MATKQQIKDVIQSKLTLNPSLTTKVDTEAYLMNATNNLIDELYNTDVIEDNSTTDNVFTKISDDLSYTLKIKKQGGVVFIVGYVRNESLNTLSSVHVASITNSEYQTEFGGEVSVVGYEQSVGVNPVKVQLLNNTLRLNSTIEAQSGVYFQFFYFINA